MVQRGEVGLIFAELGRVSKVFDNETDAAFIIVLTTLFSPLILKWFYGRHGTELIQGAHQTPTS
jgi:Na+:H+ antiporter